MRNDDSVAEVCDDDDADQLLLQDELRLGAGGVKALNILKDVDINVPDEPADEAEIDGSLNDHSQGLGLNGEKGHDWTINEYPLRQEINLKMDLDQVYGVNNLQDQNDKDK